ncbi:MAG: OB-fold nucleic acid binding domain-containing protein, partial [Dehalococcoidia bacterium]
MSPPRRTATAAGPVESLRKVLELERKKGYRDDAAVGGLDRFLRAMQERDGLPDGSPVAQAVRELPQGGYRALDAPERRRWLQEALRAAGGGVTPAAGQPARRPPPAPRTRPTLDSPVTVLKGVKEGLAVRYEKLGVRTVRDLLYLFPRRHNDYAKLRRISELTAGEEETVRARVWNAEERQLGRRKGTEATVGDDSGTMRVVWFNNPFVARQLRTNAEVVLSGRVRAYRGRLTLENPEYELWDPKEELTHTGRLVPVYPQTEHLSSRSIRRVTRQALDDFADALPDPLPPELRERLRLMDVQQAVRQAHYPDSQEQLAASRRRLAIDEMLPLQISVLLRRRLWQQPGAAGALALPDAQRDAFLAALPFALTGAQQKSLDQILSDLARDVPMSRLLQGDVGSGKTVVAACGLVAAA